MAEQTEGKVNTDRGHRERGRCKRNEGAASARAVKKERMKGNKGINKIAKREETDRNKEKTRSGLK